MSGKVRGDFIQEVGFEMKLYVSIKSYSLENLYKVMVNKNFVGILSSGAVTNDETIIPLNECL